MADPDPSGNLEVDLVRGLRERREEAVAQFLERYRSLLYHCIAHFEADAGAREDLFQELVAFILGRLDGDSFDHRKGSLGTWLYRVAWCRCVDLKRKEQASGLQPAPSTEPKERAAQGPGPGEIAAEDEVGDYVRRALGHLEPEERRLLELRFVEERTHTEIAECLGISIEQAKYRVKRARTHLRRVILNEYSLVGLAHETGLLEGHRNTMETKESAGS